MSITEKKEVLCNYCPKKCHCTNRNTGIERKDFSCFSISTCVNCPAWFYCQNQELKDRQTVAFSSLELKENGLPSCFIAPMCHICPRGDGACKNAEKNIEKFKWNPESYVPMCHSPLHSTR